MAAQPNPGGSGFPPANTQSGTGFQAGFLPSDKYGGMPPPSAGAFNAGATHPMAGAAMPPPNLQYSMPASTGMNRFSNPQPGPPNTGGFNQPRPPSTSLQGPVQQFSPLVRPNQAGSFMNSNMPTRPMPPSSVPSVQGNILQSHPVTQRGVLPQTPYRQPFQQPAMAMNSQQHLGMSGGGPSMVNGDSTNQPGGFPVRAPPPQMPVQFVNGPPQSGGVNLSTAHGGMLPPPQPGHPYVKPGLPPPPPNSIGQMQEAQRMTLNPSLPPGPPLGVPPGAAGSLPPPQPSMTPNSQPGTFSPPHSGRPNELPLPYHGHGNYSHSGQGGGDATTPGLTPNSSESPSQRSSRAPSPVPGQKFDALEGGYTPTTPQGGGAPPTPPTGPAGSTGITGRRQYPTMPGLAAGAPPQTGAPGQQPTPGSMQNNVADQQGSYPSGQYPQAQPTASMPNNTAPLNSSFNNLKIQPDAQMPVNLLQERSLLPPVPLEPPKPNLPHDYKKVNASTEIFRATLNSIPNSQSLLNKSRLPLGILIHPFKDLAQLPVIQSSVIVRCRSCRTYINPFVSFVDMRRWKCNLCYRVNELPEEFNYDPVSKSYGEPQRRPEIRSATIEFIAPSEYMLRPPQPAVYLFMLDVSFNAVETGYLSVFCRTLLEELERLPGDARTMVGFITYDRSLHFYNLSEGLSQPQMLVVSDVDEVCLPCPDNLLVNMHESRELIVDLLNKLPSMFAHNLETGSALGPALQTAYKLMSSTGGRVTVMQTQLPTVGAGALKNREDPNERAGKKVHNLGPATDFYKKMSLDCSAQQIAVDMFLLNSQYADIASVAGVAKYSGGCLHYFPGFHTVSNPVGTELFEGTLRRYLTRKIGFESVMRIRCTRGLSIHTFHGNFFVRSTDLLSLPNVNPDAGFGMQMSIEDNLDCNYACFQAALLYTSSKGERRIRVHTLCLPITNSLGDIYANADQQAIVCLLSKMGTDKSLSSMGDARDAMVNAAVDLCGAFGQTLTSAQRMGTLQVPYSLRLLPLYILALLKSVGFRVGSSTKLDDRVCALELCKTLPVSCLLQMIYPDLYPVHALDDKDGISKGDSVVPQPPLLQLSAANLDRHGVYLLDTGTQMYLWVGGATSDLFCQQVFDVSNFGSITDGLSCLPELENQTSERLHTFINHLNDQRPIPAVLTVLREDSQHRDLFLQSLVEDRTESSHSYYEFLQHIQKEVKS